MPKKRKPKARHLKAGKRIAKDIKKGARPRRKPGEWPAESVAAGAASILDAEDERILQELGVKAIRAFADDARAKDLFGGAGENPPNLEVFGPKHPAWSALGDDDWNGATFANVLNSFGPETRVLLVPDPTHSEDTIQQMVVCVSRFAYVKVQRR